MLKKFGDSYKVICKDYTYHCTTPDVSIAVYGFSLRTSRGFPLVGVH